MRIMLVQNVLGLYRKMVGAHYKHLNDNLRRDATASVMLCKSQVNCMLFSYQCVK